ncbi:MAG: nucleoside-diphosphate kinase [Desulfovibrionaceae bacterium]|jgi:nucleoside-diphosphate kinase|uniref:nucleoside-diphosphate kinase n=1 Tax=Desulfovibrio TaxID=872 RepID=UPI00040F1783|nr:MULTISPECIES: nucleoside-diphosphate kinase [Desulfovibrio]MCM0754320.1 nucleoside-diphosphate kinase [Desulfovibrio aminophilus]MDY0307016.1 nucleoside-diphosphate kinase [Desulfovibrionaceae bacterium]HMM38142.1 nucleoside-diphosphate kinase [Desulfovibrio sp.]
MSELTFSIVKPDAVEAGQAGSVLQMIIDAGLKIKAMKMIRLTREQAEGFYAVHRERPFFKDLVNYMISGPVVVSVLEGDNAIARYRELMGATDPAKAAEGTIRKRFGKSIEANACHGSDGPDTAKTEVAYFFSRLEMVG